MTAFHSAFFRDAQAISGNELAGGPRTGRALSFHIGPDPVKPGLFRRRSVARVVDFGNYHPLAARGMAGDWAILELEDCLGREYGYLPHLRPSGGDYLPRGPLMTISFPYAGWNRVGVAVEEGCRARGAGPVTGLIAVDCAFEAGMSGGPVLERQPDGQWQVVGIMQLRVSPVEGVLPAFAHRHRNQMVHAVAFFRSLERVLAGTTVRDAVADEDAEQRLAFERAGVELVLGAQRDERGVSPAVPEQGPDPVHLAPLVRIDQVRRQCLPGGEDHFHQRDGGLVRKGRRERAGRVARDRDGQAHRFEVPPRRARLWRVVLPQRHASAAQDR